jgi:hypothetical protein
LKNLILVFSLVGLVSCASITGETTQPVSITIKDLKGNSIEDVNCKIHNDKGAWETRAPSFVTVSRSAEDLIVECKKPGYPNGLLKAISRAGGTMWGNVIFGVATGGIGAYVDHERGAGYNYPDILPLVMGKSVIIDRSDGNVQNAPDNHKSTF